MEPVVQSAAKKRNVFCQPSRRKNDAALRNIHPTAELAPENRGAERAKNNRPPSGEAGDRPPGARRPDIKSQQCTHQLNKGQHNRVRIVPGALIERYRRCARRLGRRGADHWPAIRSLPAVSRPPPIVAAGYALYLGRSLQSEAGNQGGGKDPRDGNV
jgi:hypothetical protein